MCQRVTKMPKGDIQEDLKYMGDIEMGIRDWQNLELSNSQLIQVDNSNIIVNRIIQDEVEYDRQDICKNHLKLLETFCLDDKQFTCWMCHHFNYSDVHRGHKVVSLEEAYRKLRVEYKENLGLLLCIKQFVDRRLSYLNQCRDNFKKDLETAEKQIDSYINKLIRELQAVQEEKKKECRELYQQLDKDIIVQLNSLEAYKSELVEIEVIQPKSLYETLKLFKTTNVFLKNISSGIQFPEEQKVFLKVEHPNTKEEIQRLGAEQRQSIITKQQTIKPNLRDIVNPLQNSKILPEDCQYDMILQALPNFTKSQILYRLTEHKLMGQTFRNLVYDKGATLLLIKANNGHIFGGFSPISWTDEMENNWKKCQKSFLFTITDNNGREPQRLELREGKEDQALYHSRTQLSFGSGYDLCLNLIDLKKSESAMYSYSMPARMGQDVDKFLAGKRDKWEFEEMEVFKIVDPIEMNRYPENRQSLIVMAQQAYERTRDEQLMEDIIKEEEELIKEQQKMFENKFKNEDEMINQHKDSVVKYQFLYKDFLKSDIFEKRTQLL
eukprot:403375754